MKKFDTPSGALGFASWVFSGRGKAVTLFQVLVMFDEDGEPISQMEIQADGEPETELD